MKKKQYEIEFSHAQAEQFFKSVFGLGKTLEIDDYAISEEKIKTVAGHWEEEYLCRFVLHSTYFKENPFDLGVGGVTRYGSEKKGCVLHIRARFETSAGSAGGASDNNLVVGGLNFWITKNLKPKIQLLYMNISLVKPPKSKTFLLTDDEKILEKFEAVISS